MNTELNKKIVCSSADVKLETPRIQKGQILIGHILCHIVEQKLFGE